MSMEWKEYRLKELATYINGKAFKPSEWRKTGVPIIRIENLNNPDAEYNYFDGDCERKYCVENGEILISWSATLDTFRWQGQTAYLNQHIFKVVPRPNVSDRFIFWLLKYAVGTMAKEVHGSTMKHITKPKFDNFIVRMPVEISEQERMATRIEKKNDKVKYIVETARTNYDAVVAMANAILREAFPWQPGDKLPSGWRWEKLVDCCEFKNGVNYSAADLDGEVKIIGVGDFQDYSHVKTESLARISTRAVGDADYLATNDIVVVRSNGNPELVGRHMLFDADERVTHSGFTIRLRLNPQRIKPDYYLLYAKSPQFRDQIKGQGANISNLSQGVLKKVAVPVPDTTAGQTTLVKKLQGKLAALDRLRQSEQREREAVEALPAAILREAFDFGKEKAS